MIQDDDRLCTCLNPCSHNSLYKKVYTNLSTWEGGKKAAGPKEKEIVPTDDQIKLSNIARKIMSAIIEKNDINDFVSSDERFRQAINNEIKELKLTHMNETIINGLYGYIKDNLFHEYNKKKLEKSGLVKTSNEEIKRFYFKYLEDAMYDYKRKFIDNLIIQSRSYRNIVNRDQEDVTEYSNTLYFGNYQNMIDPTLFALFAVKFKILEILAVYSDSWEIFNLFKDLLNNRKTEQSYKEYVLNSLLINKRLAGCDNFFDNDSLGRKSETNRILFHMTLRKCIYKLRKGILNDEIFGLFNNLVSSIMLYYPEYTKEPVGYLEVIFRIFNFRPVFPLKDYGKCPYASNGKYYTTWRENIGPLSEIIYSFNSGMNKMDMTRHLLNTLMNTTGNSPSSFDFPCSFGYGNISNDNKVIYADYILPIEINRKTLFNSVLNKVIVQIDPTITINDTVFTLKSGVCINIDNEQKCYLRSVNKNQYALVKIDDDKWFKYSKDIFEENDKKYNKKNLGRIINSDIKFKLWLLEVLNNVDLSNKVIYNNRTFSDIINGLGITISTEPVNMDFTTTTKDLEVLYMGFRGNPDDVKKILNGTPNRMDTSTFLISTDEAIKELSSNGVLLIYDSTLEPNLPCGSDNLCQKSLI